MAVTRFTLLTKQATVKFKLFMLPIAHWL